MSCCTKHTAVTWQVKILAQKPMRGNDHCRDLSQPPPLKGLKSWNSNQGRDEGNVYDDTFSIASAIPASSVSIISRRSSWCSTSSPRGIDTLETE